MEKFLEGLRQVRASNIIFLFMIPIIIYFLATSRNYLPALQSVLGVEENALELLASFSIISLIFVLTLIGGLYLLKSISIDQKQGSHNPRSTVATVTEIMDHLRLLWARVGVPHCPTCGVEVARRTVQEIVDDIIWYFRV